MIGISQRDCPTIYAFLNSSELHSFKPRGKDAQIERLPIKVIIQQQILELHNKISNTNGLDLGPSYTFDVYIDKAPTYKARLLDFNIWMPSSVTQADLPKVFHTDALLYDWETLNQESDPNIDFRTVDSQSATIVQPLKGPDDEIVPADFVNLKEF